MRLPVRLLPLLLLMLLLPAGCSTSGSDGLDDIEAAHVTYIDKSSSTDDACYPDHEEPADPTACLDAHRELLAAIEELIAVVEGASVPKDLKPAQDDCETELPEELAAQRSLVYALSKGPEAVRKHDDEYGVTLTRGCSHLASEQRERSGDALDRQAEVVFKAMGIVMAVLLILLIVSGFFSTNTVAPQRKTKEPASNAQKTKGREDPVAMALTRIADSMEQGRGDYLTKVVIPLSAAALGSLVTAVIAAFLS